MILLLLLILSLSVIHIVAVIVSTEAIVAIATTTTGSLVKAVVLGVVFLINDRLDKGRYSHWFY